MTTTVKKTGNRNVHLVTMGDMEEECGPVVTSVQEPCFIGEVGYRAMLPATDNSSGNKASEVINPTLTMPKTTGCRE